MYTSRTFIILAFGISLLCSSAHGQWKSFDPKAYCCVFSTALKLPGSDDCKCQFRPDTSFRCKCAYWVYTGILGLLWQADVIWRAAGLSHGPLGPPPAGIATEGGLSEVPYERIVRWGPSGMTKEERSLFRNLWGAPGSCKPKNDFLIIDYTDESGMVNRILISFDHPEAAYQALERNARDRYVSNGFPPDDYLALALRGKICREKGSMECVVKNYREIVRLQPGNAQAHAILADALARGAKPDLDGAIAEQREFMRLQPENPVAHYLLCEILFQKGDFDGAIKECRTATQLMPKSPPPHYLLGKALQAKGELQAAIDELRKATELDPKNGEYQQAYKKALKMAGQK